MSINGILKCAVLGLFALVATTGCGSSSGLERIFVEGAASYRGKPLEKGEIRFVPIQGTKGPANTAQISEGRYRIIERGGVPAGMYRVEIQAFRAIPNAKPYTQDQADGRWDIKAGDIPEEQFLPIQFNRTSKLEVLIDAGGSEVTKDFDLK